MEHHRADVTELTIGDTTFLVKGSLIAAKPDDRPAVDWELMVTTLVAEPLEPGSYDLTMTTSDGQTITGRAMHVRAVETSHVFRGAGPLDPPLLG